MALINLIKRFVTPGKLFWNQPLKGVVDYRIYILNSFYIKPKII